MDFKLIKSKRKTLSLSVDDNLNIVVRAPYSVSDKQIEKFVYDNEKWIKTAISRKTEQMKKFDLTDDELKELIKSASEYLSERVDYYSAIMNLKPTSLKITKAKKRFGSCSAKNAVCFSCYLMQYPVEAIDYVVVHELAHIRHHNHSKDFYSLVEYYMPDYKKREKLLK